MLTLDHQIVHHIVEKKAIIVDRKTGRIAKNLNVSREKYWRVILTEWM
jgi:hypothetical protein